jgi:hypothetical protein
MNIVPINSDTSDLLDSWAKAELNGVEFPVPFDAAWQIAGYSNKANAKQSGLKGLKVNKHFSSQIMKNGQRGRSSELILLSVDGFKHICLMVDTPQGEAIRDYFIDAENKWKLAQKIAPQVASDVEMMMLKIELAKLEAQKEVAIAQTSQSDLQLIQFRHYISTALPEHQQQKVLGYSEVKVVETRDRLVSNGVVINDGSTINKTELCKKLGFMAKSGAPDYKALNLHLAKMPEEAFETIQYLKESPELKREWIPELQHVIEDSPRQRWLGE